jgi:hypothetical protein
MQSSARAVLPLCHVTCTPTKSHLQFADTMTVDSSHTDSHSLVMFLVPSDTDSHRLGTVLVPSDTDSHRLGTVLVPSDTDSHSLVTFLVPSDTDSHRLGTVLVPSDTDSHRLGTFLVPNLMSIFRCLCRSQLPVQASCLVEHLVTFHVLYGEDLLASRQAPKLKNHPLSAVRFFRRQDKKRNSVRDATQTD